jgi:hypothetical protein
MHAGVVGDGNNHAGVDPCVGNCKQRVGGDIQANVLHSAEAPFSAECGAKGYLHSHFFVGRPFRVAFGVFGCFFVISVLGVPG